MRTRHFSAAAAIVLLLLSGCGGTDAKVAPGDASAKASAGDIDKYFESLNSYDETKLEDALKLTAPDSVAHAYATYTLNSTNAATDGGTPYGPLTLTKVAGGYKSCDEKSAEPDCVTWANVESAEGKLAKFTVDGKDLTDRISVGDGSKVKVGSLGTVEFLTAYQSVQSDAVFINVRVTSGDDAINIVSGSATYRGTDKRQTTATGTNGPKALDADSTAYVQMYFDHAKPGGELKLALASELFDKTADARIKTR